MARSLKKITLQRVIEEASFGAFKTPNEAKPALWGLLFPLMGMIIFWSLWPVLIIPGIAIVTMVAIGEEERAVKTLKWSFMLPGVLAVLAALWALFVVF